METFCYKPPDRMKVSRENYIKGAKQRKVRRAAGVPSHVVLSVPPSPARSLARARACNTHTNTHSHARTPHHTTPHAHLPQLWGPEALEFQEKLLASSGLGDETYFPDSIVQEPMRLNWESALEETEGVLYETVHKLFKQAGVGAQDIDILIVVCSCFAPTPSLASMIVNHFKMRTDVLSHNLAGMGCSSGAVAIDMARNYLQALPNKRVLVVAHENITANYYAGNNRSMLVSNCLFRVGGAAMLMSNRCVQQRLWALGRWGARLPPHVVHISNCIEAHLRRRGLAHARTHPPTPPPQLGRPLDRQVRDRAQRAHAHRRRRRRVQRDPAARGRGGHPRHQAAAQRRADGRAGAQDEHQLARAARAPARRPHQVRVGQGAHAQLPRGL